MSKYNPEGLITRSADQIQEAIVNHPDNADCRDEKDLLCSWRRAYECHMNEGGSAAWRAFQKKIDGEKSPSMRALTLLAEKDGCDRTVFHADTDKFLTLKWMLESMPQEQRIDLAAIQRKVHENQIRLPEPGPELSPVVYNGMTGLCRIYIKANASGVSFHDPIEKILSGELFAETLRPSTPGHKLN